MIRLAAFTLQKHRHRQAPMVRALGIRLAAFTLQERRHRQAPATRGPRPAPHLLAQHLLHPVQPIPQHPGVQGQHPTYLPSISCTLFRACCRSPSIPGSRASTRWPQLRLGNLLDTAAPMRGPDSSSIIRPSPLPLWDLCRVWGGAGTAARSSGPASCLCGNHAE